MTIPSKLYKYCPFSVYALRAINDATIYFASPEQFNDPLDCRPTLQMDVSTKQAEQLLSLMLVERGATPDNASYTLRGMRERAAWPDPENDSIPTADQIDLSLRWDIQQEITRLLRIAMAGKGVLSLSATYSSALMWSHYADHHRGLCLEYDTSNRQLPRLQSVDYRAPRAVRVHDLYRWKVDNDDAARNQVLHTYFYAKSDEWNYEQEWREINDGRGEQALNFRLSAVYFGMRADDAMKQTIIRALSNDRSIELHQMYAKQDSFKLHRSDVERDYFEQTGVRQPPFMVFGDFPVIAPDGSESPDTD